MDVLIVSVVVHHLNLSVPWWYRRIIFSCLCVVVGRCMVDGSPVFE